MVESYSCRTAGMESHSLPLELTTKSGSCDSIESKLSKRSVTKCSTVATVSDKGNFRCSSRRPVYKLRTFSSKGAFLVLVLNFLVWSSYGAPTTTTSYYLSKDKSQPPELTIIPALLWFPAVLLFGLLADIRYGRKKTVFIGLFLMWMVTLIDCARVTSYYYSPDFLNKEELFVDGLSTVSAVLASIANAPFLVNSVQLAIDQLADASGEQVSSFIQWYVFSSYFGAWIFRLLGRGPLLYCFKNVALIESVTRLAQTGFITLAVGLSMVCGDWIDSLPIGENPLKLIWGVLRFASKHKHPVYRSAHTYWEDKIPSRINLGKDKYGGPFTNEQVEDVKTFFRIISLTIPSAAAVGSSKLVNFNFIYSVHWTKDTLMDFNYTNSSTEGHECIRSLYATFVADSTLWICVSVLCSEFILFPFMKYHLLSMLKRIGFAFFLTIPMSVSVLVLNIAALIYQPHTVPVNRLLICCIITVISSLQTYLLVSSFLEFICAQSPQSMKGFLIGFMWLMTVLLSVVSYFIYILYLKCTEPGCGTGYFSLVTTFSTVGFVIYCVMARWYRNRERDDCPNVQAIIEEVFARRLAHRDETSSV